MKIAFFSEIGHPSGTFFPRNYPNARTDVAWAIALQSPVFSIENPQFELTYDLGIVILPKDPIRFRIALHLINRNSKIKKWAIMQEGPNWYYQDYTVSDQINYLNAINFADLILCHNEFDRKYFSGLLPGKNVIILPSLMIEDSIDRSKLTKPELRRDAMIGGNFTSWYSGVDSLIIAQELSTAVYAPSMGRKKEDEEQIEDLTHLPYLMWNDWIYELSKRKYGIHLMRTHAAGTFALNCGYLGIPCVGYRGLDTQEILFPNLTVDLADLESARKVAIHLRDNELFYNHTVEYAKKMYQDVYHEDIFRAKMLTELTNFFNGN